MTISWLQAIILGIFACLSSMPGMGGTTIGNYTLGRPLVAGLVCGIVLGDIQAGVSLIPSSHLMENWNMLLQKQNGMRLTLGRAMINSLCITVPGTFLAVYCSCMTAYGIHVYNFKAKKFAWAFIMAIMMVPNQITIIGFYRFMLKLNLVDTYIPLIIPAIASPGTVFFLRQYVLSVMPPSLIEAARIDGASELYTFHRIAIPIMSPGIATMSIMGFIGGWNAYLLPMIILNKNEKFTLPVMMATLRASGKSAFTSVLN